MLVTTYERGNSAADQQAASRAARAVTRDAFRKPEEAVDALSQLDEQQKLAAETAIIERLGRYAKAMANGMLETFDERLPMPEVLLHLRTIYDFRRMPWQNSNALEVWATDSIA